MKKLPLSYLIIILGVILLSIIVSGCKDKTHEPIVESITIENGKKKIRISAGEYGGNPQKLSFITNKDYKEGDVLGPIMHTEVKYIVATAKEPCIYGGTTEYDTLVYRRIRSLEGGNMISHLTLNFAEDHIYRKNDTVWVFNNRPINGPNSEAYVIDQ